MLYTVDGVTPDSPACGAKASEGAVIQKVQQWFEKGDENGTWYECLACGEIKEGSRHQHQWEMTAYATEHRIECKECGAVQRWEIHTAPCDRQDACELCGAKVSDGAEIIGLYHTGEEVGRFDEICHWTECSACRELLNSREYHTANCQNPDICLSCGHSASKDGIEMAAIYHGSYQVAYDAKSHWHVCDLCGEISHQAIHTAPCYMKTICAECGARAEHDGIVIGEVTHPSYRTEASENGHRMVCEICGGGI